MSWLGSEAEIDISVSLAFRLGLLRKIAKFPRDIIVKFPYWETKTAILEKYWEQTDIQIEGNPISVFPDISALRKRKLIRFLTLTLQDHL